MFNPIKVLGLADEGGDLSFNKFVTLVLLATFAYAVIRALNPSPALLAFGIFVGVAGFGLKAVMAYLDRSSFANTMSQDTKVELKGDLVGMIRAVKEKRVAAALEGTQDTGQVPQVHND